MVTLNDIEVECLVDTGADVSILSNFVFDQISNISLKGFLSKLRGLEKKIRSCPG